MLRGDFERVLKLLEAANTDGTPSINELLVRSLYFFNTLKEELKDADKDRKKEILELMEEMHKRLAVEVEKISKKTGMSEDQLMNLLDDPAQFTPQQREIIQATRSEVNKTEKLIKGEKEKPKSKKKKKEDKWMKS